MYMTKSFLFTSEAVSEGHPDKVCDQISDGVLDAVLAQDAGGHVACETLATTNFVSLAGEVNFQGKSPDDIPAVLVHSHGPFTWGTDPHNAVHNAVVLEELAFMAFHTEALTHDIPSMQQELLDKHYLRKHGKNAYYGQG